MAAGVPCNLGSNALFASAEDRKEASETYHKYEFNTLDTWKDGGFSEYTRLAYRIFAKIPKEKLNQVLQMQTETEIDSILALDLPKMSESLGMACVLKFLVDILQGHGYFDKNVSKSEVIKIMHKIIGITCKHAFRVFLGEF